MASNHLFHPLSSQVLKSMCIHNQIHHLGTRDKYMSLSGETAWQNVESKFSGSPHPSFCYWKFREPSLATLFWGSLLVTPLFSPSCCLLTNFAYPVVQAVPYMTSVGFSVDLPQRVYGICLWLVSYCLCF